MKLGFQIKTPIIFVDNNSSIKLAESPEFHKRSKHIDVIYHFTRNAINENKVQIYHIPGKQNIADFLTKIVENPLQKSLLALANIRQKDDDD